LPQGALYHHNAVMTAAQPGRIIIRRSSMDFEQPIVADFSATASSPHARDWAGRWRRCSAGERVGELEGEFAVIPA